MLGSIYYTLLRLQVSTRDMVVGDGSCGLLGLELYNVLFTCMKSVCKIWPPYEDCHDMSLVMGHTSARLESMIAV